MSMKSIRHKLLVLVALPMLAIDSTALAQSVDTSFNPNFNWAGNDCCIQRILHAPGGGYYIVGQNSLRRVASNGTLDGAFNVGVDDTIDDALVQPSGKVVIVGEFSTVGFVSRPNIARINADGTVDTAFNPGLVHSLGTNQARVFALGSGKLLVSSGSGGGFKVTQNDERTLLQLSADGTIDNGMQLDAQLVDQREAVPLGNGNILWFGAKWDDSQHTTSSNWAGTLGANGGIQQPLDDLLNISLDSRGSLSVGADGRVLVLGFVPDALPPSVYNYFGKLTLSLGIDFGFQPNQLRSYSFYAAHSLHSLPDARTLFIGHYRWNGEAANQSSDRLGRVLANGGRDMAWVEPVFNAQASAMLLQADGSVVVGGAFTTINGVARQGLARILPEAPYDPIFKADFE